MTTLTAVAARTSDALQIGEWKQSIARGRERLKADFLARPAPTELVRQLAALVDTHLREIWKSCEMPRTPALVAVGGYGRGELYPHSDVDVLVLLPAAAEPA